MITNFKEDYYFLSNYYNCEIPYEGLIYKNAEAAFQSMKTLDLEERKIFVSLNPDEAKCLGRKIKLREDWEDIKDKIMYEILMNKFECHTDIREKLLETGDEELLENTTGWHDNYWGNCDCEKCKNIQGRNQLGKILMKLRDYFKNTEYEEIELDLEEEQMQYIRNYAKEHNITVDDAMCIIIRQAIDCYKEVLENESAKK